MQDNETPIEEETQDTPTTEMQPETIGFVDTSPDTESAVPIGVITAVETPPPMPVPGKYDAVYNREAHSRSNMRQGHKAKKVERLFVRGENLELRGSLFKVTAVGHKTMILQLLPKPKETEDAGTQT
jgi:hypothetical protein